GGVARRDGRSQSSYYRTLQGTRSSPKGRISARATHHSPLITRHSSLATTMFVAKVTGSVVATQKVASMTGQKLLVVEPYRVDEADPKRLKPTGRTFVAVDTVGAGTGEFVLIVQGSSARLTPETKQLPVDAAIIGIVDSVHLDQQCVF